MKKLFSRLCKTGEESIKDPEILVAVSVPTKTKTGLICKIVYIIGQILENFKKNK